MIFFNNNFSTLVKSVEFSCVRLKNEQLVSAMIAVCVFRASDTEIAWETFPIDMHRYWKPIAFVL